MMLMTSPTSMTDRGPATMHHGQQRAGTAIWHGRCALSTHHSCPLRLPTSETPKKTEFIQKKKNILKGKGFGLIRLLQSYNWPASSAHRSIAPFELEL